MGPDLRGSATPPRGPGDRTRLFPQRGGNQAHQGGHSPPRRVPRERQAAPYAAAVVTEAIESSTYPFSGGRSSV
jgi:hypothetical protein